MVELSMKSVDDGYELRVADDGVGLPPGVDFRNPTSLGLELVNSLVRQLHGTLQTGSSGGTEFIVRFPQRGTRS